MAANTRLFAFALALLLPALLFPSSCIGSPVVLPAAPGGYQSEGIISKEAGTVSAWAYIQNARQPVSFAIFQTDDVRIALFYDSFFSGGKQVRISRIAARAVGNGKAHDNPGEAETYPEASIIIDNNGSLSDYRYAWYSPVRFPAGEWHLVTMRWSGYPNGKVGIYFDGKLAGSKNYSKNYNIPTPLFSQFSISVPPGNWMQFGDISFYPCTLDDDEIPASAGRPARAASGQYGLPAAQGNRQMQSAIQPAERVVSSTEFFSGGKKYLDVRSVRTVNIFFGLIPVDIEVQSKVDAETNATLERTLPWWHFIFED